MIRNVTIHVTGEQPLLCDLFDLPSPTDAGLLCTNVRGTDGKRPVFIDATASTFFFPYHVVRFVEIPEGALARRDAAAGTAPGAVAGGVPSADGDQGSLLPVAVGAPGPASDDDPDGELEIDEGFLQRIRDI